jgi:hypothetical protein
VLGLNHPKVESLDIQRIAASGDKQQCLQEKLSQLPKINKPLKTIMALNNRRKLLVSAVEEDEYYIS